LGSDGPGLGEVCREQNSEICLGDHYRLCRWPQSLIALFREEGSVRKEGRRGGPSYTGAKGVSTVNSARWPGAWESRITKEIVPVGSSSLVLGETRPQGAAEVGFLIPPWDTCA